MKRLFSLFILLALFVPPQAFAHVQGVPVTTINGKLTKVYPVENVVTKAFNVPENADLAPENYAPGEVLNFTIDKTKFQTPESIFAKTAVIWDFGDGTAKQTITDGFTNTHRYLIPGTFVMTVTADYRQAGFTKVGPQVLQATVIHVFPESDYTLPKPVISVNGQESPSSKSLDINLSKTITFDALKSHSLTTGNTYMWDFGDGQEVKGQTVRHQYTHPKPFMTVLLRVHDSNGMFSDEYVTLNDTSGVEISNNKKLGIVFLVVGIAILGVIYFSQRKRRRRKKGHRS